jgi:FMN phosphatase YigB (HAD superfamily)
MKPSPIPFIAISQRTGIPPSRVLFIGDSFEKDVVGAHAVGMTGGLLLREDFKVQQVQMLEDNLKTS